MGHLLAAGDAAERLKLDRVLWVPAGRQPLKASPAAASSAHRRQMVVHTIAGDPRFQIEAMELEREGLSFTVDTLAALTAREPAVELFLLIGADSWAQFGEWREPRRVRELATVVVLSRQGDADTAVPAEDRLGGAPVTLTTRRIDISATEIRRRVREGRPIRGFVTDAVERYITESGLYKQGD